MMSPRKILRALSIDCGDLRTGSACAFVYLSMVWRHDQYATDNLFIDRRVLINSSIASGVNRLGLLQEIQSHHRSLEIIGDWWHHGGYAESRLSY